MGETIVERIQEATGGPLAGEAADPSTEPQEDLEDDESGAGEPGDGDVEEEETSDAPEAQSVRDEKELDRAFEKVRREHERHANRIQEIVGADFEALAPCPLCSHFADGFLGLVELPEQAIPQLRAILGMPDLTTFHAAEDARTCPRCGGLGRVLTGSNVPGYEVKDCQGCNGIGWIGEGAPAGDGHHDAALAPAVTGPTVYDTETDDPQVMSLRERGFTVIPPMRTPGQ
jgi:hypothetical protein